MEKIFGFCGLVCSECPAFIATKKGDDKEKERIAKEWSREYKHEFKIEDINCDGCISIEGRHIGYCSMCEVRVCAVEKGVKNCAYCEEHPCETINNFFDMAPQAKRNIAEIKKSL